MALKTGRITKKEQERILLLYQSKTISEIAKELNRREINIQKFIDKHAPIIVKLKDEDQELLNELHGRVEWPFIKEQFSDKELNYFEINWVQLFRQFNRDVEKSEEMQIIDLIKLRILAERNLIERNSAKRECEGLEQRKRAFVDKNGVGPYEGVLNIEFQTLITEIRSFEMVSVNKLNEYKTLIEKQGHLFKELKATREQRIELIKNSKKDWVGLMKSLKDEKFRLKEGRELELMNIATEKEKERLMQYHTYADQTVDKPILNEESI